LWQASWEARRYIIKDTLMNIAINTPDDEPDEDAGIHINIESKAP
jgi:hypothetical protein